MRGKKLSFIIPAYNCADFIDETAGSVISQLPEDCELILVDDGSSDGTAGRLREMEAGFRNIRAAYAPHGGASSARNTGLEMAQGEWAAFMDCDDCLIEGFFEKAMPLLDNVTDLYTFSFERVEYAPGSDSPEREETVAPMTVEDRVYKTASDYADQYIRTRDLLVYSACNKFYRRSILNAHGIRFREGMHFGEDRLFNYDYLMHCGQIVTSSIRMFRYIQRNPDSASKRFYPDIYETKMMLHRAKMDCFLSLSREATQDEKEAFEAYDLAKEQLQR